MRKTQSYQKQQSQNLRKKMANFLPSISHPVNSEKSTSRFVQAIQDGISNGSLLRPSKNVQTKERLQKPPFPASFRLVVQKNLMPLVEIVMILEEVTNYMLQTKGTLLGNFKKKIILGATKKICELKFLTYKNKYIKDLDSEKFHHLVKRKATDLEIRSIRDQIKVSSKENSNHFIK